ncbi:hypothetical protein AGLY_010761 [Aphis glycines]|uniref:Uncharacterized protein n=1 Tax=Aphis glycines TaxID=307491 RepID=A0A6G0TEM9_APHGL|nr:hypothetical protein AGLY_010761 [Aphis glycines]
MFHPSKTNRPATVATSLENLPRQWCLRSARAPGRDWTGAGVAGVRAPKTRTPAGRAPLEGRTTRGVDTAPERSGDLPPMAHRCTWTRNRNPGQPVSGVVVPRRFSATSATATAVGQLVGQPFRRDVVGQEVECCRRHATKLGHSRLVRAATVFRVLVKPTKTNIVVNTLCKNTPPHVSYSKYEFLCLAANVFSLFSISPPTVHSFFSPAIISSDENP